MKTETKTYLEYVHTRSLFTRNEFKPMFKKWLKGLNFEGTKCGNWEAFISVTNWEDVKDSLPTYLQPIKVHADYPFNTKEETQNKWN